MVLSLILMMTIFGGTAEPEVWQCRNDLEIRCDGENCEAVKEGAFTPMSVRFDDAGSMTVCAYSGCWEGTGDVFKNGEFLVLTGQDLSFSTSRNDPKMNQSIVIALDKSNNVAMLKAGQFAHPVVCRQPGD